MAADIAVATTAELSPPVTKRPPGKTGARRVSPGYFRPARVGAQQRYDDVIGNFPV